MEPIHIADISKNKSEIIRVEITEFKGKNLVNVRTWYLNDQNEYAPTKKGVAVSLAQLEELRQALNKAHAISQEKFADAPDNTPQEENA